MEFEKFDRRGVLIGASAMLIAGCGGESPPVKGFQASPSPTPTPTPAGEVFGPEVVTVRQFYLPEHGSNLQPAFQAAIDAAATGGKIKIINDFGPISAEMWAPVRMKPFTPRFGTSGVLDPEGTPLVIRQPVDIDFRGANFTLKGPGGGSREQWVDGYEKPWLGGWIYIIGYTGFGRVALENVKVDGTWSGELRDNRLANLSDKGFRIQDTEVDSVVLNSVELQNFGAEVYYNGGLFPRSQQLDNCHFHGSPQCAFNPGGVGSLIANNLKAGRSFQAAEVIGGTGHTYNDGLFYDAYSASFFGGPKPGFRHGFPFWYALWDGQGEPPFVKFGNTKFANINVVQLGAWMQGQIDATDTYFKLLENVGHLRGIDLALTSRCDTKSLFPAITLNGPMDLTTTIPGTKEGTYVEKPSDIKLKVNCLRSDEARSKNFRHQCAVANNGGLLDANSIEIEVTGEAPTAWQVQGPLAPGFAAPRITTNGFAAI